LRLKAESRGGVLGEGGSLGKGREPPNHQLEGMGAL